MYRIYTKHLGSDFVMLHSTRHWKNWNTPLESRENLTNPVQDGCPEHQQSESCGNTQFIPRPSYLCHIKSVIHTVVSNLLICGHVCMCKILHNELLSTGTVNNEILDANTMGTFFSMHCSTMPIVVKTPIANL